MQFCSFVIVSGSWAQDLRIEEFTGASFSFLAVINMLYINVVFIDIGIIIFKSVINIPYDVRICIYFEFRLELKKSALI
jgi:hypothetical protein